MVATHYRWDFIGLSTDTKPTPETSEKVVDGSTFYCSDNSKLYVWCKNQWYEKEVSGGGGTTYTAGTGIDITDSTISVDTNTIQPKLTAGTGIDITDNTISATGGSGPTVVQTTGNSTTDVMSQDAVTGMVFADPGTNEKVQIGSGASSIGMSGVAIGRSSNVSGAYGVSIGYNSGAKLNGVAIGDSAKGGNSLSHDSAIGIGYNSEALSKGGVALGAFSSTSTTGEMNIGSSNTSYGYSNTAYRLLTGLYDGQSAHDAVTIGQINNLIDAINTATGSNISHIGA